MEAQKNDPTSILALYRRLLDLRRREEALSIGDYIAVPAQGDLLSYRRQFDNNPRFLIIMNLGSEPALFHSDAVPQHGVVVLSTQLDRDHEGFDGQIRLRGDEGLIIQLTDD